MKQQDIALILVIGFISAVLSLVASSLIFSPSSAKNLKSESVTEITATFAEPDKRYFNSESVDPTQIISIGNNANQTPFNQ